MYSFHVLAPAQVLISLMAHQASSHSHYHASGIDQSSLYNRWTCNKDHIFTTLFSNSRVPSYEIPQARQDVKKYTLGEWTQEPLCTSAGTRQEFCIFTSSTFNNDRGISVFTTKAIADELLTLPAFSNSSSQFPEEVSFQPPSIEKELPGRGIGLIAKRTLTPGDRIFAHSPATIFHSQIYELLDNTLRFEFQRQSVERLPKKLKELWFNLHGHFDEEDEVDDITNTNSFVESFGEADEDHYLVLPETSRINHDCRPNSQYYFDSDTMTHYVHASRTIYAGEELTISYTDPLVRRSQRRQKIKTSWGFNCSCSLCTQSKAFTEASDRRIREILRSEKILDDRGSNSTATPQMAEFIVSLYQQERLDTVIGDAFARTALEWSGAGNEWKTIKWASMAAQSLLISHGPTSIEFLKMRLLTLDPKSHWSWRARKNDVAGETPDDEDLGIDYGRGT